MKILKTIGFVFLSLLLWALGFLAICLIVEDIDKIGVIVILYFLAGITAIVLATKWFIKNGYRLNQQDTHLSKHGESAAKLAEAKFLASKLNNSSVDVFSFCRDYTALCECMDRLIWLNEKRHVYMDPRPRANKARIANNLPATVNGFIDRSIAEINSTSGYAAVTIWLNDLRHNEDFNAMLSKEVDSHINHVLYEGFDGDTAKNSGAEYAHQLHVVSGVDTAQIIQDELNWRQSQLGLSDVDYELYHIDHMEGHAFEHWCADLLRKNGFTNVEVTRASNDQGVDVLAEKDGIKYAVQCKCYSSDLGNTPIQEVNAGKAIYHCHVGAVMTNRHFTAGAKEAAKANNILLWDRDYIAELLKNNS